MPGTEFIGTTLLEEVAGNYDRRTAELTTELQRLKSRTAEGERIAWREAAEDAVSALWVAVKAGTASDSDLSHFSISSPPYAGQDDYKIERLERSIEELGRAKEKALAYVRSLAAGPDGVVTLYAADLKRIGYGL